MGSRIWVAHSRFPEGGSWGSLSSPHSGTTSIPTGPAGLRAHTRNQQVDAVQAAARRDEERLAIAAAPVEVRDTFRHEDGRNVLAAAGRKNPHAAGSRAVQIPRLIHLDPVGASRARIGCGIEINFPVG